MKIVSIVIKASHEKPEIATMLEFCAVGFDTQSDFKAQVFHRRFAPTETFQSSLNATVVNAELMEELQAYLDNELTADEDALYVTKPDGLLNEFSRWVADNNLMVLTPRASYPYTVTVCGKNFSRYGEIILSKVDPSWGKLLNRRSINVAEYYIQSTDELVPDLKECRQRSGLFIKQTTGESAKDNAIQIALMVHTNLKEQ